MQQEGAQIASICVAAIQTTSETTSCDDPAHIAVSGIAITEWKGGNMPVDEELVYQWKKTKSGFTVLFFTIVIALVTWGAATALTGSAGFLGGAGGASLGGGLGGASFALAAGALHVLSSTALHSGGGLTQAQSGFFGSTGNGVLQVDLSALSEQSQGLAQGIQNRHIKSAQGHNLAGSQKLFKGTCAEDKTVAECWGLGLDPGQMWRGDTYQEVNMTLEMRAKYDECRQRGLAGPELMQCAAPNATS